MGKKNRHIPGGVKKGGLHSALSATLAEQQKRQKQLENEKRQLEMEKARRRNLNGAGGSTKAKHNSHEDQDKKRKLSEKEDGASEDVDERNRSIKRRKRTGVMPYCAGEKVLLIGEGNFSFAHSLLLLRKVTPTLLVATAFDTLEVAQEKYPDLMDHVRPLKDAGATVLFGVDATKLEKCREVKEGKGLWDIVVFNFPHVGLGITDQDRNVRANQTLLLNFYRSVAPFLRTGPSSAPRTEKSKGKGKKRADTPSDDEEEEEHESDADQDDADLTKTPLAPLLTSGPKPAGRLLLSLRTNSPYSLWHLPQLATKGPLLAPSILPRPLPPVPQPTYRIIRSWEFDPLDYPGYEHRRTIGFKEGVSEGGNEDLKFSARERGVRKFGGKVGRTEVKEKAGGMRTWELELVIPEEED
ncbi:hypothetical protein T439DRAFT_347464 [Meredithblackwellia eburnea MCA 4105]